MTAILFKLNESKIFQFSVIFIIILNAVTLGISTYELNPFVKNTIQILDYAITVFFVIEILIRFISEPKKLNFFKSGWNIFDTTIVLISLIPIPNNSSFLLLRLLRVFRVLRIISITSISQTYQNRTFVINHSTPEVDTIIRPMFRIK